MCDVVPVGGVEWVEGVGRSERVEKMLSCPPKSKSFLFIILIHFLSPLFFFYVVIFLFLVWICFLKRNRERGIPVRVR